MTYEDFPYNIVIDGGSHMWDLSQRDYIVKWCKENCHGKFYVSILRIIRLELEDDFVIASLVFG